MRLVRRGLGLALAMFAVAAALYGTYLLSVENPDGPIREWTISAFSVAAAFGVGALALLWPRR